MYIKDLFKSKKVVYSFEIFPPKADGDINKIYDTIEGLKEAEPDYISVTYSAGGSKNARTAEIASIIKNKYKIEPLAHLTCINSNKEVIDANLKAFKENGIDNILALRGDRVAGAEVSEFNYATELVEYIKSKKEYNFDLSGACYVEGHPEAESLVSDIRHLKEKVDAGVGHLNSQLFYDNEDFYRFMDMTSLAGINVPIQAGIMPLIKKTQIERIVTMTGVKIPSKIARMFARFSDNPEALREAGIAYATDQIIDLLSAGVSGIHLYVMNDVYVANKITSNIKNILIERNK